MRSSRTSLATLMAIAAIAAPAMPSSKPMPSVQPRRYRSNIDPRIRSEIESWNDAVDRRKAVKRHG